MRYEKMTIKNKIINYLEDYEGGFGFQELCDLVINNDNCVFCGTCIALCPRIGILKNKPALLERDTDCSLCSKYCARTFFPEELFEKKVFSNQKKDFILGCYQRAIVARSSDELILKKAQNGGIITTLLIHALNTGYVDGVLLIDKDEDWRPIPVVARTAEQIIASSGSKYTIAPTLLPYGDAIHKYKLERLAFVGMPCQIQAVRKLQIDPPLSNKLGKFKMILGLFCTSNYSYDLIKKYLKNNLGLKLGEIQKFDIIQGKLIVLLRNGKIREIPLKDVKSYQWPSCQYCKDYTAEFADISVGSVGAPSEKWNSVIIRSDAGKKLFDDVVTSKKIEFSNKIDITKIEQASLKKKSNVMRMDNKVISAMRFFNISEIELKTYSVLISLGYTDLSILGRVMNINEVKVRSILNKLKQRNWIAEVNGGFRPYSPYQVFKDEMKKFKIQFKEMINKIKSDELKELEDLFLQNNFMHVLYNEFIDSIP
ncbi:MAG: hypothetical protein EU529_10325 [Promethearchaeota archaeon]|nr:MAG: hypothetical protein EU529_10325 [Candidatus Lokiarchaeota archaeon]